jgi:hypothetical protein
MKTRKRRPKLRIKRKTSPLFWSSLVFTTNMVHAFFAELYIYSFCFACLTITSLVVHTKYNIYTDIIDKFVIASIVIYGLGRMWEKYEYSLRTLAILFVCVLSFLVSVGIYGYQRYIIKHNPAYHSAAHYICSLGHHLIILL